MSSRFLTAAPLGAVFLCVAGPGPATADPAAALGTLVAPAVVVANRTPMALDQVASSVTLITADDIDDNQWRGLSDALADVPGLGVVQTGGPGGQTSVFIRGANSNHTKVIIDGIDANDPSEGAFDFGRMLTSDMARIEVLRGPASSLYGSDALGGVINIVTRDGAGPPRVSASVEGGSFRTLDERIAVSGSDRALSYSLGVAHDFTGDTPVTPIGLLAPGEARLGDRRDNLTGSAKFGLILSHDASLHLVARYTDDVLKFVGDNFAFYPAIPDAALSDQRTRELFTRAEARFGLFGDALKSVLGLGYTDYRTLTRSPDAGVDPALASGNRLKVDYQATLALDARDTLVFGAEDDEDRLLASPIDASDGYKAGYVEWQTRPVDGLNLAASVRYDDDDRAGSKVTWRIAPTWLIAATGTRLKATYGTGFKAPTLTQLFVSYPGFGFYANPDLKPETSEGYDVGFEQPLARGRLRLGATWFHTVISNLIDTNPDYTSYANVGRATTYGVESFVAATLSRRLALRADYTWTEARDDIANAPLLRRPRVKASLAATWRPTHRLSLTGSLLYVGAWRDVTRDVASPPTITASPFATLNLAGSYDLGRGVSLFARVDNALDRHYQQPVGFDKPGIGAYGGVKIDLKP